MAVRGKLGVEYPRVLGPRDFEREGDEFLQREFTMPKEEVEVTGEEVKE